jgi:hypothetical protein
MFWNHGENSAGCEFNSSHNIGTNISHECYLMLF